MGGRRQGCRGNVIREIVVVFYWGEGSWFAEETEVVDWCWVGEEGLDCWWKERSVLCLDLMD